MKVFILRNAWRHQDFGGAEELAISLVKELSNYHDVKLISGSKETINRARISGISFIEGPYSTHQILTKHRFIFIPKYLLDLHKAKKKYIEIFKYEKPDIIHCTGQQDSISATAAAKQLGIPVIWSDHGELKNSLRPNKFIPPFTVVTRLIKKQIPYVKKICMINPEDIEIVKNLTSAAIVKIPNGVSDEFKEDRESNYDMVFASRVIREKGIFETLEAFEILSKDKNLSLLVAGEGPSLEDAKKIVNEKKLNVTFENYSDAAITRGRVFILPTYTEAQSLAIIKAMMYQQPIITTAIEGNLHFLQDKQNAVLVPTKNAEEIVEAFNLFQDDSNLRNKISSQARQDYLENFAFSKIIRMYYLPMYESLMTKR